MEEGKKIDLKRHTSPPVSKWYLLRISLYILILTVLGIIFYSMRHEKNDTLPTSVSEIEGVAIQLNDTL